MEQQNKGTKEQRNKGKKEQRNKETKSSSNWVRHNQVSWSSLVWEAVVLQFFNISLTNHPHDNILSNTLPHIVHQCPLCCVPYCTALSCAFLPDFLPTKCRYKSKAVRLPDARRTINTKHSVIQQAKYTSQHVYNCPKHKYFPYQQSLCVLSPESYQVSNAYPV